MSQIGSTFDVLFQNVVKPLTGIEFLPPMHSGKGIAAELRATEASFTRLYAKGRSYAAWAYPSDSSFNAHASSWAEEALRPIHREERSGELYAAAFAAAETAYRAVIHEGFEGVSLDDLSKQIARIWAK